MKRVVVIVAVVVLVVVFHGTCQAGEPARAPYSGPVWKPSDGMKGIVFRGEGEGDLFSDYENMRKVFVEKKRILTEYLKGKYKRGKPSYVGKRLGVEVVIDRDGAIAGLTLHGEMKVPGFKMKGTTDDDYRAAARAFLNEEKELFGLVNVADDLKETGVFHSKDHYTGMDICTVEYQRHVEGIIVKQARFGVTLNKNGTIAYVNASVVALTPDMREAAKRFKTEGLTEEEAKAVIRADFKELARNRGFEPGEDGDYFYQLEAEFVMESPYMIWRTEHQGMNYVIDAFTGKVLSREERQPKID